MEKNEYVVIKISEPWSSKKTDGTCLTIVSRHMKNHLTFKAWPDSTFKSWQAWSSLQVGDIFTNVIVYDERRKLLSSASTPLKTGHIDVSKNDVDNVLQEKLV